MKSKKINLLQFQNDLIVIPLHDVDEYKVKLDKNRKKT